MGNVEIPKWLKLLPLAPEFRPTDTEFADPIAYISKIEKEAGAFGICKVIPPIPKPSKRYVFSNLKKSFSRTRELGLDVNLSEVGDLSKKCYQEKTNESSEGKAVFTTRQQELGQISNRSRGAVDMQHYAAQKQVWQSGEFYTLEQFESKSKAFSRTMLGMVKEVTPLVIEALFWKAASEKPIYVEYANDVPGSGFGEPEGSSHYLQLPKKRRRIRRSCWKQGVSDERNLCTGVEVEDLVPITCPIPELGKECDDSPLSSSNKMSEPTELEGTAGWKLSNCPWNLQVIARSAGSLTRFMLDNIPGVTSPMVYIGMLFSWFAWHVEDHELHSLNFLHTGSPKTWYAIPGEHAFAFEDVIREQAYGGDVDLLASLKILGEKTTLLSPETVVAFGIPCCRLVQNPGEFVVTFPRAYHIGFSHGFNCGEAANFGTAQWLTMAKEAAVRRAAMDHLPMLSHQQLLYLLTMSFTSRVPRTLLPGVRTSRLKNRQKEEREMLVKKAFIEDVLKENHLLNTLLGEDPAFRAVLWHPDLLPSVARDYFSQAGSTPDALSISSGRQNGNGCPQSEFWTHKSLREKDDELSIQPHKGLNQDIHHLTSHSEPLNELYLDNNDLLCDFQVDSGTLLCVACGILGYPIMSVVQPSKKAFMEIFPAKNSSISGAVDIPQWPNSCDFQCNNKISFPGTTNGETWGTSGFLRPRFFCLEHAVQIEELLRPKGGAKILVICHSDYRKIKENAVAVAAEIRTRFNYKEAQLDSASAEELKLIDIAIDEQVTDLQEDWTSKLGTNLQFSVKTRKGCLSKNPTHALSIDYLLSVMAPALRISNIKWCSRKSRTKRELNQRTVAKSCNSNLTKKDVRIHVPDSTEIKEKVLLQYSRRKYRSKPKKITAENFASGCSFMCSTKVADTDGGMIDYGNEHNTLTTFCFKNAKAASEEFVTLPEKHVVHKEDESPEANRDLASNKTSEMVAIAVSGDSKMLRVSGVSEKSHMLSNNPHAENCSSSPGTATFYMIENSGDSETCKHDSISSRTKSTTTVEKDMPITKMSHGDRSKRTEDLQIEAENNFVKSPCEGLRPRRNKKDSVYTLKSVLETEGKSPSKKLKRTSGSSVNQVPDAKTSYGCNVEGCQMRFKTKVELSLHKRNQCHHKECGKRFRSHKYAVLHQRVHDDDRPLKCTWDGCSMSFKWAWARTEHMRLHTGERPYCCKIKGCGLTFRFVSDFSRHRRKTGHYVNLPSK